MLKSSWSGVPHWNLLFVISRKIAGSGLSKVRMNRNSRPFWEIGRKRVGPKMKWGPIGVVEDQDEQVGIRLPPAAQIVPNILIGTIIPVTVALITGWESCSGVWPEGSQSRRLLQFQRRQFYCPGPSFVWSADGFDKLKPYGLWHTRLKSQSLAGWWPRAA